MDVTSETFERDVLEREAQERVGELTLAKVDVDANPELATRYRIRGIPAVKAFRYGQVVREFVGVAPPAAVARFLDELIGPGAAERLISELTAAGELPDVVDALEQGQQERALVLLLEACVASEGERRERLIRLTVGLFGDLGDEHPLTMRYRRRLAASLY